MDGVELDVGADQDVGPGLARLCSLRSGRQVSDRQRERSDNDERLARKAQAKLDDLEAASTITDPAALDRKRAVIEAAMARARARRGEPR